MNRIIERAGDLLARHQDCVYDTSSALQNRDALDARVNDLRRELYSALNSLDDSKLRLDAMIERRNQSDTAMLQMAATLATEPEPTNPAEAALAEKFAAAVAEIRTRKGAPGTWSTVAPMPGAAALFGRR